MSNGEGRQVTPNSEANAAGGASIASREPSGVEIAKGWLALLEPDAYLIPPPTITRKQLLTVARTLVVLHEFAEKYATHTDPFGRPSIEPVSETRAPVWVSPTDRNPDLDGRLWVILIERREKGKRTGYITAFEYYHFIHGWATDDTVLFWLDSPLHPLPAVRHE